jgi:hypothetical protein
MHVYSLSYLEISLALTVNILSLGYIKRYKYIVVQVMLTLLPIRKLCIRDKLMTGYRARKECVRIQDRKDKLRLHTSFD